jgi:PAS domain S-box-containing protein
MKFFENDNYKPGLTPPKVIRGSGWLSSNMAQVMVFLNGLILTVTAYATLGVFMNEIISDNLKNNTNEIHNRIQEYFYEVEKTFALAEILLTDAEDEALDELKNRFRSVLPAADYMSSFVRTQIGEDENFMYVRNLFQEGSPNITDAEYKAIIQRLLRGKEGHVVGPAPANMAQRFIFRKYLKTDAHPAIVAKLIEQENGNRFVFAGLFSFHPIMDTEWLEAYSNLKFISIRQENSDRFLIDLVNSRIDQDAPADFSNVYTLSLLGQPFEMRVAMMVDNQVSFLTNIPLLMLLFGMTLTFIGTLYVRNNQKQSIRLANMNRELAEKNFELNTQINEREKLNSHIRKSERENRALIDSVSDIIFEASTDGDIIFLNATWKKVTGFNVDACIGRNLFDLLHPQDQEEQEEQFQKLVKGQRQAYRSYTRLRASDNSYHAVELAISMIRQDETKNLRVVGTITDVEERNRAERALAEAGKEIQNNC